MTSVLVKDLSLNFGAVEVLKKLNLDVAEGEFIVLLGPSGCGKSTLLNCIAGLLDVSAGPDLHQRQERHLGGAEGPRHRHGVPVLCALSADDGRGEPLLRPEESPRLPKDEIAKRVARAAEILQIEPLLQRKPAALSGGQRQRVAIGRALVRDVDVFLFDEPLSNLDAKLRSELRVEIKRLHQRLGNTMIYVTHDQIEAMTLADRIAVMWGGVIQQLDAPQAIYNRPVNRFVAGFIGSPGMNFLEGALDGQAATRPSAAATSSCRCRATASTTAQQPADRVVLGVRPEHIFHGAAAHGQPFSQGGRDRDRRADGFRHAGLEQARQPEPLLPRRSEKPLQVGDRVPIGFDPARASMFDGSSGNRI